MSIIAENKPHVIYENIYKFFEYREIQPKNEKVSVNEFNNLLLQNVYIEIDGINTRSNNDVKVYLFIDVDGKSVDSTTFNKFIKNKIEQSDTQEILMVINNITSSRKKKIEKLRAKKAKLELYDYDMFSSIKPENILVPEHILMSQEEQDEFIETYKLDHEYIFPFIEKNDPQVVWIGGESGDLIKIINRNEISGLEIKYRKVI